LRYDEGKPNDSQNTFFRKSENFCKIDLSPLLTRKKKNWLVGGLFMYSTYREALNCGGLVSQKRWFGIMFRANLMPIPGE